MQPTRIVVLAALCGAWALCVPSTTTASAAEAAPERTVTISGEGAGTYPAYSDDVPRFAVTTTEATGGHLTVLGATTDPDGRVRINGQKVPSGTPHEVTGLSAGDEVNVQISDSAGQTNQSWFYLPPRFPALTAMSTGDGPAAGQTLLTLGAGREESFTTAVDQNAVPSFVLRREFRTANLALQPNGRLAVALALSSDLYSDHEIWQLDARQDLQAPPNQMVGHPRTDFHDFVLLPDGGGILMAYLKRDDGQTDSWFQEVATDGTVLLDWNSADHVDEAVDPVSNALGDYAHLNSIDLMSDGNLLLSFRHLSQVMKVDRTTGEVLWRLGGVRSDFVFPDDPFGGPCAQHTARELANGDIQVFDNGSVDAEPMCPDPTDPGGSRISRPESRVAVYRLDEGNGTAALVEERSTGSFNRYAGAAQRLGAGVVGDHLLMGLNDAHEPDGSPAPDVIELAGDGSQVWSLDAPGMSSYRAERAAVPDATRPAFGVRGLVDGAHFVEGTSHVVEHWCTDTGGSNLATCSGSLAGGQQLDLTPGQHRLVLHASDLAGNTRTRRLDYTVHAAHQPDVAVRLGADDTWVGSGELDPPTRQRVRMELGPVQRRGAAHFRVRNAGAAPDRVRLLASLGTDRFGARWFHGRTDVTRRLADGMRTPVLEPGEAWRVRLVVTRARTTPSGTSRTFELRATSKRDPERLDAAGVGALAR